MCALPAVASAKAGFARRSKAKAGVRVHVSAGFVLGAGAPACRQAGKQKP